MLTRDLNNSGNKAQIKQIIAQNPGINLDVIGRGMADGLNTPLINAVQEKDVELVRLFLDNGADPNFVKGNGGTPAIEAAYYGCVECARLLKNKGANAKIKDTFNQDACHYADRNPATSREIKNIFGC